MKKQSVGINLLSCAECSVNEVPGEKGGLIGDIMEPVGEKWKYW